MDASARAPAAGGLDVSWVHGSDKSGRDPPLQVHMYDDATAILRQSKDVSFEAPFLYLFFGKDSALLLDTGAAKTPERAPIRRTVDELVESWLARHPREGYQLVVAHTHGHGDHVAGDPQFAGRAGTTVVGRDLPSVKSFFGMEDWPRGRGRIDLGGRVVEVIGSPGHHPAAVSFYDPRTRFLVTGDTVYPGRLYVSDYGAFVATLDRLVAFTAEREVSYVMGCHIEMTDVRGKDYPITTRYQPDEPPLQMTVPQLVAVRDAAKSLDGKAGARYFDDFAIYNGPCTVTVLGQIARGTWGNFARSLGAGRRGGGRGKA